jgi:hypothetical protein
MATHLDLEEQEQLDQLKHFWNTYGNPDHLGLLLVAGAFAAWNGWQYWQRSRRRQASALYDEVERSRSPAATPRASSACWDMKTSSLRTAMRSRPACWRPSVLAEKGKPTPRAALHLGGAKRRRRRLPGDRQAAAGGRTAREQVL